MTGKYGAALKRIEAVLNNIGISPFATDSRAAAMPWVKLAVSQRVAVLEAQAFMEAKQRLERR